MRGGWIGRPGRIRAVVFDFDGTLALTPLDFAAMRARVIACAERRGLPIPPGRLPILELIEETVRRAGSAGGGFRTEARALLEADETAAARNALPVTGAAAALERLRGAGLPVGIITRNCRAAVGPLVRRMGIPCDVLLTRDDVAAVKPDPVHLRSALRRLGVPAAGTLVVGDHPFDVRAARRLGMPSAAVLTGGKSPADFLRPRPDVILEDVTELPVCLGLDPLPAGKLQNRFLGPLLERFTARRPDLPVGPGVGLDCAVLASPGRFILGKADPITLVSGGVGPHLLAVNANDIAAAGGRPRWLFTTFLFPVGTTIAGVREVFEETAAACRAAGVAWAGGHSEVTDRVSATVAAGCLLGVPIRARPVRPAVRPGDRLLQIREIGIEGAAIIARERGERLAGRVPARVLRLAAAALARPGISAAAAAGAVWSRFPVRAMHDPTEGGLSTALYEMAAAAGVGFEIDEERLMIFRPAAVLAGALGLSPLGLISSGCMLAAVPARSAAAVVRFCARRSVPCAEIGRAVAADRGVSLLRGGTARPFPRFARDEINRLFDAVL